MSVLSFSTLNNPI